MLKIYNLNKVLLKVDYGNVLEARETIEEVSKKLQGIPMA